MLVLGTLTKALAGTAAAAVTTVGLTLSAGAGTDPSDSSADGAGCMTVIDRLPDDLKHDLAGLYGLSGSELREAKRQIRQDARSGEYGILIQRFARHPHPRLHAIVSKAPAELKDDVLQALGLPEAQQEERMAEIRQDALAGTYGPEVQKAATNRQEHCGGGA
jgi:hypothetical protein